MFNFKIGFSKKLFFLSKMTQNRLKKAFKTRTMKVKKTNKTQEHKKGGGGTKFKQPSEIVGQKPSNKKTWGKKTM